VARNKATVPAGRPDGRARGRGEVEHRAGDKGRRGAGRRAVISMLVMLSVLNPPGS